MFLAQGELQLNPELQNGCISIKFSRHHSAHSLERTVRKPSVAYKALAHTVDVFYKWKKQASENNRLGFIVLCIIIIFGFISNIVSNWLDSNSGFLFLLIIFIILGVIAVLIGKSSPNDLPHDLTLTDYSSRCINTPDSIEELNDVCLKTFGAANMPAKQVEEILIKSKRCCLGLYDTSSDSRGRLVGFASCFPLRAGIYNRLRLGEGVPGGLSEPDICADHVLADADYAETEVLFIPGVAVLDRGTFRGKVRAAALACDFVEHIKDTYTPAVRANGGITIFLVGLTTEGRRMTGKLAGHLGLSQPAGFLTIYGEKDVPFFEGYVPFAEWERSLDRIPNKVFEDLRKRRQEADIA